MKLIHAIWAYLEDHAAQANLASMSAFINYTLRPTVAAYGPAAAVSFMKDKFNRHSNPEEWAARKLQGYFRCRQARRARLKDEALDKLEPMEYKRLSPEQSFELRKSRAEAKLRKLVHRWRHNRAVRLAKLGPGGEHMRRSQRRVSHNVKLTAAVPVIQLTANAGAVGANLIFDHCVAVSKGRIKDCEVTEMIRSIADELGRTREELDGLIHRLVTMNWLEAVDDLEFVADRHWTSWEVPEKVAQVIKQKLLERTTDHVNKYFGGMWQSVASFICGRDDPIPHQDTSPPAIAEPPPPPAPRSMPKFRGFATEPGAPKRRGREAGEGPLE